MLITKFNPLRYINILIETKKLNLIPKIYLGVFDLDRVMKIL